MDNLQKISSAEKNTLVCQLKEREQKIIRNALIRKGIRGDALERGMNGRICDLEDTLPIYKILYDFRRGCER